jgi:pimeloyl-ACP methyl ester carboxylesterase
MMFIEGQMAAPDLPVRAENAVIAADLVSRGDRVRRLAARAPPVRALSVLVTLRLAYLAGACERVPVSLLVLVNAMIPVPGETPGDWWGNTGWEAARIAAARAGGYPAEVDLDTYFLRDVPADVVATGEGHNRPEAEIAFTQPCAIKRWPDVPTRVLAGEDERFFPLEFQRQVARDRLGMDLEAVPGGHLAAPAHPAELADQLTRYL